MKQMTLPKVVMKKVAFYDAFMDTKGLMHMGAVAKVINKKGVGRNKLYKLLREKGILMGDNLPYQIYMNKKWFEVKLEVYKYAHETKTYEKTMVTKKGLEAIARLF